MLLASCAAFALLLAACGGSATPSASPAADRVAGVAFAAANDFVSAAAPPIWVVRSAMR